MSEDPYDLARFVEAQNGGVYEAALAELGEGRKRGHWIWYVFPQLAGLGRSETSRRFAIRSLAEARAYLDHPLLGRRLRTCAEALLAHAELPAREILGDVDALKLRSSMTLFSRAGGGSAFDEVLAAFYGGEPDGATERRLAAG